LRDEYEKAAAKAAAFFRLGGANEFVAVAVAIAVALRSPRRPELATGNQRPEGRRAGCAPCATQAMDGLCGASLRKRRTLVALDPKTGKAPFFGYFLWQDKESDPAACGRKLLMSAGRHS